MRERTPHSRSSHRRLQAQGHDYAIVLLALAAAWVVLTWPWLSGRFTVPWDAKAHFQAQFEFLAASLHRGEWPFWNPFVFAGSPQIADPQSLIFSPPHLVAALLDAHPGFRMADAIAFGMLGLGAVAIVMVFRDRAWHPAGAVVAGLAFAFGGSAAWRIQHTGQVLSLSWWAVASFCLARALERASVPWGLAAGMTAGFMVVGRDQVAWLGVLLLALQAAWTLADHGSPLAALRRVRLALAAGAFGGLLVSGLPLVMTILLAGDSNRPAIDFVGAGRGSLHPASLLTALVANLYGTDGPLEDFWGQPSFAWGPTDLFLARNMSNVYAGGIPLLAVLAGGLALGAFAAREIRFHLAAFVLILLYALGWYTPVFTLYWHVLPGIDLFRRPADATFYIGALGAILAGYGVHRAATGTLNITAARLSAAILLVLGGFGTCAAVAFWKGQFAHAGPAILTASGFTLASAMLLAWMAVSPRPAFLSSLAVAALLTLDLAWNNGPNESTALPPALFDVLRADSADPTVAALRARLAETAAPDRRDRVELAGIDFHWPNASMVHGLDNTLGYNPLRLDLYSRATGAQDHVALPDQRTFSPLMPGYRSTLADLLGLRLIATRGAVEDIDRQLRPRDLVEIARTPQARIHENPRALPRVMVLAAAAPATFEDLLRTGAWPEGFDPRRRVLLDPADGPVPAGPAARPGQEAGTEKETGGTARITRYANTEVVVTAEAPQGGWLLLNDVWHPWWYATVDGSPVPIRRGDVIMRAVPVPPGRHEVRFVFRPIKGMLDEIASRLATRVGRGTATD